MGVETPLDDTFDGVPYPKNMISFKADEDSLTGFRVELFVESVFGPYS